MLTSQGTLPWFPSHPIPSLSRNLIHSRIMQMLPPADNNPPKIKNSSNNNNNNSGGSAGMLRPPAEQGLKCPRCDSANTKFCYYNNYSLSQPRHFCKTCRRYWTRGGALRNVPVGGGCRKSKKSKSASSSAAAAGGSASSCSAAVSLSSSSSMGNFQLGMLPSGVFNGSNQFVGFNYPIAVASPVGVNHMASSAADDQIMFGFGGGGAHLHQHQSSSSIALSIESLSSMNQDLHWKLQQQRLAMLFEGGGDQNQHKPATPLLENHHQMVGPISFQVADEGAKGEICEPRKSDAGGGATAWFLEGSSTANYSNGRINGGSSSNNNNSTSDWNAIITWNDMPQFSALP